MPGLWDPKSQPTLVDSQGLLSPRLMSPRERQEFTRRIRELGPGSFLPLTVRLPTVEEMVGSQPCEGEKEKEPCER
jgi:hypothetical protein